MNLIRFAGRSLLASYFVVNGVKTILNPTPLVDGTGQVADRVVPLAKKIAPEQVRDFVPEDPKTLVRIDGALQVAGGLALFTGLGRRLGAATIAATMIPQVIATRPGLPGTQQDKERRSRFFLRDLALLGATLVVSQDTQGKPDLAWRADQQKRRLSSAADSQRKQLSRSVDKREKELGKALERAQKKAAKRAEKAKKQVADVVSH